jgi:hypothetical protein
MHESFRTGFEKVSNKVPSLVPQHATAEAGPVDHIDHTNLTPSMGDTVHRMGSRVLGRTAGTALKALHLPREALLAVVVPQRLEAIAARSSTGEHNAAPIQTHEGVM